MHGICKYKTKKQYTWKDNITSNILKLADSITYQRNITQCPMNNLRLIFTQNKSGQMRW